MNKISPRPFSILKCSTPLIGYLKALRLSPSDYEKIIVWNPSIELPTQLMAAIPKRQALFILGRWCVQESLFAQHVPPVHIPIHADRSPIWPLGIKGSISHSNTHVLAVTCKHSDCDGIGIDIEAMMTRERAIKLKDQFSNAQEQSLIQESGLSIALFYTLVFSLKESIYKALYPNVQKFFGFEAVELLAIDSKNQTWLAVLTQDLSPSFQSGFELRGFYREVNDQVLTGVQI